METARRYVCLHGSASTRGDLTVLAFGHRPFGQKTYWGVRGHLVFGAQRAISASVTISYILFAGELEADVGADWSAGYGAFAG